MPAGRKILGAFGGAAACFVTLMLMGETARFAVEVSVIVFLGASTLLFLFSGKTRS